MSTYFSYFPSLLYGNTAITNIISKIKIDETVLAGIDEFHPYTVKEGERADQIANFFYDDSNLDWVIYLCNNIIDPLNEWPKSELSMQTFFNTKYGSVANAQIQTAYFRVNWERDERVLSTAAYNALLGEEKKYWSPILSFDNTIKNYQRKQVDYIAETNSVIELKGTFSNIAPGDVIKQSSSVMGSVVFANTTTTTIQHITGTWQTSTPVYFATTNTTANATIDVVDTILQNIPLTEIAYWDKISMWDMEQEKNESRKTIRLVSPQYISAIERDMKRLLQP